MLSLPLLVQVENDSCVSLGEYMWVLQVVEKKLEETAGIVFITLFGLKSFIFSKDILSLPESSVTKDQVNTVRLKSENWSINCFNHSEPQFYQHGGISSHHITSVEESTEIRGVGLTIQNTVRDH